jgi:hypothetical protein
VYVGASKHCTGATRAWKDVKVRGETHPTIYVARGSHANYFTAPAHISPKQCLPGFLRSALAALKIVPHDITGTGVTLGYKGTLALKVDQLTDETPWLSFQGSWGEGEFVLWRSGDGHLNKHAGGTNVPSGPAQKKDEWTDPVYVVLHTWDREPARPLRSHPPRRR